MIKHGYILFLLICCLLNGPAFSQTEKHNIRFYLPLPDEIGTWQPIDSARTFDKNTIFDLIDGGADMYLEYGFQRVVAAEYKNKSESSITIEIYEMTDAAAAYGMYLLNKGSQGKYISIGNEGMLYNYFLTFWKDRFLVYLSAADSSRGTIDGILSMANAIDHKLGEPGKTPDLICQLPSDNLITIKYFRGLLGFSSLYTFDTKNIFSFKEGVLGIYPDRRVFILKYESEKDAEDNYLNAQESLKKSARFSNYLPMSKSFTITDQQDAHICVTYIRNMIAIVIAGKNTNANKFCNELILFFQKR